MIVGYMKDGETLGYWGISQIGVAWYLGLNSVRFFIASQPGHLLKTRVSFHVNVLLGGSYHIFRNFYTALTLLLATSRTGYFETN